MPNAIRVIVVTAAAALEAKADAFVEAMMACGGVGQSSYGRFGGKARIGSLAELRWITVETQPGHYPI